MLVFLRLIVMLIRHLIEILDPSDFILSIEFIAWRMQYFLGFPWDSHWRVVRDPQHDVVCLIHIPVLVHLSIESGCLVLGLNLVLVPVGGLVLGSCCRYLIWVELLVELAGW